MASRWKDIYSHMLSAGYDIYPPGMHKGECTSRYLVLKMGTLSQAPGKSGVMLYYDLMVYVPRDEYSELEESVEAVKAEMKKLEPMIKPLNTQTGSYYDDSVKGHMVSIQYRNARKL